MSLELQRSKIYFHWLAIDIYDPYRKPNNISDDTVNAFTDNIKKLVSSNFIEEEKIWWNVSRPLQLSCVKNFKGAFIVKSYVCIKQPSNIITDSPRIADPIWGG